MGVQCGQSRQTDLEHEKALMEGCSGSLLSGGDTHSDWLHDFANTVVSKGHSRCCLAHVESEQALLNTTKVTWQQRSVWHFTLRPACKCVYLCAHMLSQFWDQRTVYGLKQKLVPSYAGTHLSFRVCLCCCVSVTSFGCYLTPLIYLFWTWMD